jgi:hypothetical protein
MAKPLRSDASFNIHHKGGSSSEQRVSRVMNPYPELKLTAEQRASKRMMDKEDRRAIALALANVHATREDLESLLLTDPATKQLFMKSRQPSVMPLANSQR